MADVIGQSWFELELTSGYVPLFTNWFHGQKNDTITSDPEGLIGRSTRRDSRFSSKPQDLRGKSKWQ